MSSPPIGREIYLAPYYDPFLMTFDASADGAGEISRPRISPPSQAAAFRNVKITHLANPMPKNSRVTNSALLSQKMYRHMLFTAQLRPFASRYSMLKGCLRALRTEKRRYFMQNITKLLHCVA
jgi:hypothetical protein